MIDGMDGIVTIDGTIDGIDNSDGSDNVDEVELVVEVKDGIERCMDGIDKKTDGVDDAVDEGGREITGIETVGIDGIGIAETDKPKSAVSIHTNKTTAKMSFAFVFMVIPLFNLSFPHCDLYVTTDQVYYN